MILVSSADRILLTALLIRAWGVDVFSDWATLMAATSLLAIAEFGFQVLLGNTLVRADGRNRFRTFQRLVSIGMSFYLGVGLAVLVLLVGIAALTDVAQLFELNGLAGPATVFLLLGLYQVLRLVRSSVTQIFRGKGEVHQLVLTDVRAMSAAVSLAALAAWAGGGPVLIAAIYLVTETIFGELWAISMIRRRFPEIRLRPALPSAAEFRVLVRSLPWYGWLSGASNVMLHLPVLIIAWIGLGGAPLAAFVIQRTLVNIGKLFSNAVSLAIGIELADLSTRSAGRERNVGVQLIARFCTALAVLMIAGLLNFGGPIVRIWTGQPDLGSQAILLWLMLPLILTAPAIPLQLLTYYTDRPQPQAAGSLVQLIVGIPLALIAGASYGVVGVAFGVAVGEAVGIGLVLPLMAARRLQIPYWPLLSECAVLLLLSLLWSGGVGWLAARLFSAEDHLGLFAAILAWGMVGALPVMLFVLPRNARLGLLAFARGLIYTKRPS